MRLVGDNTHYVILLTPETMLTDDLIETGFDVDDVIFPAYQINGMTNDFYFIYGMNESQVTDWYQYDSVSKTVQRVNTDLLNRVPSGQPSDTGGDTPEEKKPSKTSKFNFGELVEKVRTMFEDVRLLLAVMIFILAVLIIVIINIIVFHHKEGEDVFGDDDDDEDDNDINLIGSDENGLLDVDEVRLEEDDASDVSAAETTAQPKAQSTEVKSAIKAASEEPDDDEDEDEGEGEDGKPEKKRRLFFRKKKQDDIWSEPDEEEKSLFDNEDEYEKFFRRVRSNNDNNANSERVDVIDLNEL